VLDENGKFTENLVVYEKIIENFFGEVTFCSNQFRRSVFIFSDS